MPLHNQKYLPRRKRPTIELIENFLEVSTFLNEKIGNAK